jgi:NADH dehydrogenase/NADH:ubiquinone oxidoreductase subunit G
LDISFIINSFFNFTKNLVLSIRNLHVISSNLGRISVSESWSNTDSLNNINFVQCQGVNGSIFIHLCGTDIDYIDRLVSVNKFIIFQGPFIPIHNKFINLILPTTIYTEEVCSYINLEGRIRIAKNVINRYKKIYSDQTIFNVLYSYKTSLNPRNFSILYNFNHTLSYFRNIIKYYKNFFVNDSRNINIYLNVFCDYYPYTENIVNYRKVKINFNKNILLNSFYNKLIFNYYMSDMFCKNSKIMGICAPKVKFFNLTLNKLLF